MQAEKPLLQSKNQTNTYHSQTMRAFERKLRLIEMMGGKCSQCGYNNNIAALHFHYCDSAQKSFKLGARVLSNKRWYLIVGEAQKCVLLCANCHAEAHNPELSLKNVQHITNGASHRKRRDEKGVNSGKP